MTRSESITELAAALALAQGAIVAAKKDSENPHFRHRYADLASVWDACRSALTTHGLAVVQSPRLVAAGEVWLVEVETTLLHQSGQSMSDVLAVPVNAMSAQAVGSAITYARRYALAAFVGVAPEDDDANAATPRDISADRYPEPVAPAKKAKVDRRPAALPETIETITAKVMGIVKRPIKGGTGFKYVITADDQKTYGTFSETEATTAKAAQEAGLPLEITFKTTQYGRDITALHEIVPADEPPL